MSTDIYTTDIYTTDILTSTEAQHFFEWHEPRLCGEINEVYPEKTVPRCHWTLKYNREDWARVCDHISYKIYNINEKQVLPNEFVIKYENEDTYGCQNHPICLKLHVLVSDDSDSIRWVQT